MLLESTCNRPTILADEKGSVLNVALLILVLLAVIAFSLARSTCTEVKIATNCRLNTKAFYAAEAVRAYVIAHPEIFGPANLTANTKAGDDCGQHLPRTALGGGNSFAGQVEYLRASSPPRGSGHDAAAFKAHRYKLTALGHGPLHAESEVQVGFYRLGF